MKNTPEDHEFLKDLVTRAGELLLKYRTKSVAGDGTLSIEYKSDNSPVSEADLASSNLIEGELKKRFPLIDIISEENIPKDIHQVYSKPYWLIDPLDGTRSFIEGKDDFSVLLALIDNKSARAGYMYFPMLRLLISGQQGEVGDCNGEKLSVSKFEDPRVGRVYLRNFDPKFGLELKSKPMDSGLAFLNVARGELDGVIIRMTAHKSWDVAPAVVLVSASGGLVTDQHGKELKFDSLDLGGGYVVASNGRVHSKLLAMIP